jgi:hypothetical protein
MEWYSALSGFLSEDVEGVDKDRVLMLFKAAKAVKVGLGKPRL